jgi:HEPN domain-containing protein
MAIRKTDKPFTVRSNEADKDYLLARFISLIGGGFASRAGFFAQQACEKYMKAVTIQAKGQYDETHQLAEIAKMCADIDPYFGDREIIKIRTLFDVFDQLGRYGAAAKFDPLAPKNPEFETAGVIVCS